MKAKIDQFLEIFLSIILGIMVLNILWQIGSRYILGDPSSFTDELSRYLLIWLGLFGSAYALGKGMHVAIEIFERKLNPRYLHIHKLVIYTLINIFSLSVLLIGGIRLVYISFQLGQTSAAMKLSLGYVYLALPLCGLLTCFYASSAIIHIIRSKTWRT